MKKTIFIVLIVMLLTVVGCTTNQNQPIQEEITNQQETKQEEETVIDSKDEEETITEEEIIDEEDTKEDKESKDIDYTKYKFWVVFYDQYDNELQREALLYGSVPEYKGTLPEGFIKWTYRLTGYDVKEFQPIKTNTSFKAVCEYVEPVHHSSSDSPSPSPAPSCSRTDTIFHLRAFADVGEYNFNDGSVLEEPKYLMEMYTYDPQTSLYTCESATGTNANEIGLGYTGKFLHFDGQNLEVCPNINSHNIKNEVTDITAQKISENENTIQFKIFISPYNAPNKNFSVSIADDQGGAITYSINGDIVTFTSSSALELQTTATISSVQDPDVKIDKTLDFSACLAGNTLINMADGSKRRVDTLNTGDRIVVFDHNTGKKSVSTVIDFFKYDEPKSGAFTLTFDDDIDVTVVNAHSFFEKENNKYISISKYNVGDYIGHLFYNAEENRWVKLNKVTYIDEKVETYIVLTDKTLNCLTNGMLSLEDDFYTMLGNIFEFDSNLKINKFKKAIDLLKWGYWSFDHLQYMNKEGYDALNLKYLEVAIGKGMITEEKIEEYDEYAGSYESDYID